MMKNKLLRLSISIVILMFSNATFTQNIANANSNTYTDFLNIHNAGVNRNPYLTNEEIDGSAYLNDEFTLGSILTINNIKYIDVPLRYNIYNDEIEYSVNEDSYLTLNNPETIKEISIGANTFIYTSKRNKKGNDCGYYKIVEDGDTRLLARFNIVFEKGTYTTGYKNAKPPKFYRIANTFYVQVVGLDPILITSEGDLEAIPGIENKVLKAFIKREKLKIKQEEDLKTLVKLINQTI